MLKTDQYSPAGLKKAVPEIWKLAQESDSTEAFRRDLMQFCNRLEFEIFEEPEGLADGVIIRVRDCSRMLRRLLTRHAETRAGFSMAEAIRDVARGVARPELTPAFYADVMHLFLGLQGKGRWNSLVDVHLASTELEGRAAALARSDQLDALSAAVDARTARYTHGLSPDSIERRRRRQERIAQGLGASADDWRSWAWQFRHILKDAEAVERLVALSQDEKDAIHRARDGRLPFGITPYYLSLMDEDPEAGRDRAIRAQVLPPASYVNQMTGRSESEARSCLDFMREGDTSPIDLITRRYPSICIFKPFNTCPQICVYCQRNWEISDTMDPKAMASPAQIQAALAWIREHPAIHEVLVTGGDPLGMGDEALKRILDGVAAIPSVERIRIGSRVLATAPMRITESLADMLASYRVPGRRQVAVVTHIQHPYEVTPDMVEAVERLRGRGIPVFNQLVFTFFISRKFEATFLRRLLTRIGVEPYYSFNTKGKEETAAYRVPIARLLQEQKEEARLMPGLTRTDEAVYNVPGMGKNYLRAWQHRDLISILPNGSRLYEFHPWEKNITKTMKTHQGEDVPLLEYLQRLDAVGEDFTDYETIWYYF